MLNSLFFSEIGYIFAGEPKIKIMKEELTPSEALYGFCGWLTSRKPKTVMSSKHDAAIIADLIDQFCKVNNLTEPQYGWSDKLTQPKN